MKRKNLIKFFLLITLLFPLNSTLAAIHFGGNMLWYNSTMKGVVPKYSAVFEDLDMEVARFDVFWGAVEKTKGTYDWTAVDEMITAAKSSQAIIFTLYSTSQWGSKYNDCRQAYADNSGGTVTVNQLYNRPPASAPNDLIEYSSFVEKIVSRYKDKVKYWQIENEVYYAGYKNTGKCQYNNFWLGNKEEYLTVLKQGYDSVKKIDSTAKVFSAGIAFGGQKFVADDFYFDFFDYIFDKGRDYMDMVDLHLYGCVEDVPAKVKVIKDRMQKFGLTKPIWSTEIGEIDTRCHTDSKFTQSFDSPEELKLQAEEIVKKNVLAFASGVEATLRLKIIVHSNKEVPTTNWDHMSLTLGMDPKNRKPGYDTYQIMIKKLKDFSKISEIEPGVYKFEFTDKNPVIVAWSNTAKNIDLSKVLSSQVNMTNIVTELKNGTPVYKEDKVVNASSVAIDNTPIFIESVVTEPVIPPATQPPTSTTPPSTITPPVIEPVKPVLKKNQTAPAINSKLAEKLSGRILLQVQSKGEAWYVNPDSKKRYYLGRPDDAFAIMREQGLGAKHDLIHKTTIFPKNLLGKILLDVEVHGEAYYINPVDKKKYYLGRPADAFKIMRELGLGISNSDLDGIKIAQ